MTEPRPFFGKNNYGGLFRLSLWISVPNFTFVALPVPEILMRTLKILGVTWPRPCQIFGEKKLFRFVSLVPAKTCAKFLVYSFIRSKDITPNRMHVLDAKCLKCTQKSCYGGFRVGKFDTLMLRPLGNQCKAKHVIWCKNNFDMSLRLFSRTWQGKMIFAVFDVWIGRSYTV